MVTRIMKNGREWSNTTVSLPRDVRDEARARGICIAKVTLEAIQERFRIEDSMINHV